MRISYGNALKTRYHMRISYGNVILIKTLNIYRRMLFQFCVISVVVC